MIYCYSYPFKEPGGYCISAGGTRHAFPGPHQTARACLCTAGGDQGKKSQSCTLIIILCIDVGIDKFFLFEQKREGILQTAVVTKELTTTTE